MGDKSHKGDFTAGAVSYIEGLVGERLTGQPAREEFNTIYTDKGNSTEPEAIEYFCNSNSKIALRDTERGGTHKFIKYDDYCACTPDALIASTAADAIFNHSGESIKVAPLEVKCPSVLSQYIKLFKCNTPEDLKRTEKLYYYQIVSQLIFCDSLVGYFAAYNEFFPIKMKVITFRKMDLIVEIKNVLDTLHYAKIEIEKTMKLFNQ
jgi:hypothetical protein